MGILLAIALGVSTILFAQIRMIRGIGNSVIAFSAADTGMERALYDRAFPQSSYSGFLDLNNNGIQDNDDSSYNVTVTQPRDGGASGIPEDEDCSALYFCIKSIGKFEDIKRAIEVER